MTIVAESVAGFARAMPAIFDAGDAALVEGRRLGGSRACADHSIVPDRQPDKRRQWNGEAPGRQAGAARMKEREPPDHRDRGDRADAGIAESRAAPVEAGERLPSCSESACVLVEG